MFKVPQQEQLENLYSALCKIANSITPSDALPGTDATGGHVASLTEAVMGHTKAVMAVAEALTGISDSIDGVAFQLSQLVELKTDD